MTNFALACLFVSCMQLALASHYHLFPQSPFYYNSYPGIVSHHGYTQGYPAISVGLVAVAQIKGSADVAGTVVFFQPRPPEGPVFITGNITGVPKGNHGFHIHRDGDLRNNCDSMGPHYNPYLSQHGGPIDPHRHVGDLGNVQAGEDGIIKLQLVDEVITLTGPLSVVGRGIVLHENEDDLGRGGTPESLKTGNAGGRLGCGIIGYAAPESRIE